MSREEVGGYGVGALAGGGLGGRHPREQLAQPDCRIRLSPVQESVERLGHMNSALHESITELVNRLLPVLGPQSQGTNPSKSPDVPPPSTLARVIDNEGASVAYANQRLREIIDRLEL